MTVQKIGQYPPWDIAPDPQLATKLGDRANLFKKGLICESQSYGIGAFAYYRRIMEEIIDELLADIVAVIPEEGFEEYSKALDEARRSHRTSDKIEHVKDLVPAVLRPGGANPLGLLFGALSNGIHSLSDEECLCRATVIRNALVFLVHQIRDLKQSEEQFKKDLQMLMRSQGEKENTGETN